ncbi:SOS response-associated peptidase [uncultured Enterovirga sp.]|uniref:SOS response-associated peptidase n=1 Tax=uncultured Enterovirga sp. TaxID=2026352 RepID=UPI0035CB63E6
MCGRVIQARDPTLYTHVVGGEPERPVPNTPPHYNGAPGQDYLIGRRHPKTGERTLDVLRWGLIPSWAKDRKVAWKFINARAESVATTGAFKTAYAKRRCLVPVDGFYEWRTVGKVKQPYAIGMTDGQPFTLAGLWENWKDPDSGEWTRTFTIVTTSANDLVAKLHDRMPVANPGVRRTVPLRPGRLRRADWGQVAEMADPAHSLDGPEHAAARTISPATRCPRATAHKSTCPTS